LLRWCTARKDRKRCTVWSVQAEVQIYKQSGLHRLKYRFPSKEWDSTHRVLKHAEYAFNRYMDTDIIQHISCARSWVKFKTMEPSPSSTHKKSARYYNGLGFGINVYLRSHIGWDFAMSIGQAHINNHDYQVDDRILCSFAFPLIGTAVALRPGDSLLFNPQEPNSISSHCKSGDEIFAFLLTLKRRLLVSMIIVTLLCNPAIPQVLTSNTRCTWAGETFLRQQKKVSPAHVQRQVYSAMDM
jgi:hypothetical protein